MPVVNLCLILWWHKYFYKSLSIVSAIIMIVYFCSVFLLQLAKYSERTGLWRLQHISGVLLASHICIRVGYSLLCGVWRERYRVHYQVNMHTHESSGRGGYKRLVCVTSLTLDAFCKPVLTLAQKVEVSPSGHACNFISQRDPSPHYAWQMPKSWVLEFVCHKNLTLHIPTRANQRIIKNLFWASHSRNASQYRGLRLPVL